MLTYTRHDERSAAALVDALAGLYAIIYAEPPYNEGSEQVDRFREGLLGEIQRPGFTLITAQDAGDLVGAAYGWTMPAGTWWSRADTEPPAEVRDADKLAVMEWMVRRRRRGEGIGAELMRQLLADRPEPYATLASNPDSAARRIYARNGWQQVAGSTLPWDVTAMDLLVLPLPAPVEHH